MQAYLLNTTRLEKKKTITHISILIGLVERPGGHKLLLRIKQFIVAIFCSGKTKNKIACTFSHAYFASDEQCLKRVNRK